MPAVLLVLTFSSAAEADPFQVTGGAITLYWDGGHTGFFLTTVGSFDNRSLPPDESGTRFVEFGGSLHVAAVPFIVEDRGDFPRLSTAFTMTGFVTGWAQRDRTRTRLFSTQLAGRGTTSVGPFRRFTGPNGPLYAAINTNQGFEFEPLAEPVPEPGTLLLIGSGGVAVGSRLRRRKSP